MHLILLSTILLCLFCTENARSQERLPTSWYLTRGGPTTDESWSVDTDSSGDIYWVTHETMPGEGAAIYLYKLTQAGEEIWRTSWSGNWNNQGYVVRVREPYVYVGGATWNGLGLDSVDLALVCFETADGDSVWDFTWDQGFGYEEADGLVVDDAAIYVSGWTTGEETETDLLLLKLSLDGQEILWTQTWGTAVRDVANGHIVVDEENVYVAGYTAGDALVMGFDKATGEPVWSRTWGGFWYDEAYGMTGDGTFLYVVGVTNNYGDGAQIFLLKYPKLGDLAWERIMGGPDSESARSLGLTGDGHILIAGKTTSYGSGGFDVIVYKYTVGGDPVVFRTWGGAETDEAHDIMITGEDVYIAGETFSYGEGQNDALLIRTNTEIEFPADAGEPIHHHPPIRLEPSRPNPLRTSTQIRFSLTSLRPLSLKVVDPHGREVATLLDALAYPGDHVVSFQRGNLPAGIYFCRLATPEFVVARKLVIIE